MDIFAEPEAPSEKNAGLGRSLLALRISGAQLKGLSYSRILVTAVGVQAAALG